MSKRQIIRSKMSERQITYVAKCLKGKLHVANHLKGKLHVAKHLKGKLHVANITCSNWYSDQGLTYSMSLYAGILLFFIFFIHFFLFNSVPEVYFFPSCLCLISASFYFPDIRLFHQQMGFCQLKSSRGYSWQKCTKLFEYFLWQFLSLSLSLSAGLSELP